MANVTENDLRSIFQLQSSRLRDLQMGEALVRRTGCGVEELIGKVTLDRLALGAAFLREARAAMERPQPSFRNGISRAYYSMYQTFRGIVFFATFGDEHEKHSDLPKHLPKDFPAVEFWENALKGARLERNKADYEPYPLDDEMFKSRATEILKHSIDLVAASRTYLSAKGLSA